MKRWKNVLGIFLVLLSFSALITAIWFFRAGHELDGFNREKQGTEENETAQDEGSEIYAQISDDLELLAMYEDYNADVVGILRIPGTVLNHPVVQTPDEEDYYLLRGLDGEYNSHGVPFLSAQSQMEGEGGNRIIYGHNIRKRTRDVFCDLAYYEDLAFYKEHPVIETVSKSGTRRWLIFAYFLADNADENPFRYSDTVDFLSKASFQDYMEEVEARNWLQVPVARSIEDTYLTLSSCSNELAGSGTNRMVVMAVETPYYQDVSGIVDKSSMAESPKLPEKLSPDAEEE